MISFLKKEIDWFARDFKWYRRLEGGIWYKVNVVEHPHVTVWIRKQNMSSNLNILKTESYPIDSIE